MLSGIIVDIDHQVQALSEEAALRKELLKEASYHAELKRIAADFPLLRVLAFYMRTHKSNKNAHASVSVQIKSRVCMGNKVFGSISTSPKSQKSTVNSSPFQPLEIPKKNCLFHRSISNNSILDALIKVVASLHSGGGDIRATAATAEAPELTRHG